MQTSVVSLGAVTVAADLAGVSGRRCQAGVGRQAIRAAEEIHVATDGGQDLGSEQVADPGHAGNDGGLPMGVERGLDLPVDLAASR